MILNGRVWKLGAGVGATDLLPARYDKAGMMRQWDECRKHVLEDIDPTIAAAIRPSDIIVAGAGFGTGHAHYYSSAVMACRTAGIGGFLAEGIGGMFQRASLDFGMPAWVIQGITGIVEQGDILEADLAAGTVRNLTSGASLAFKPVAPLILDILVAGGSEPWALNRVGYVPAAA